MHIYTVAHVLNAGNLGLPVCSHLDAKWIEFLLQPYLLLNYRPSPHFTFVKQVAHLELCLLYLLAPCLCVKDRTESNTTLLFSSNSTFAEVSWNSEKIILCVVWLFATTSRKMEDRRRGRKNHESIWKAISLDMGETGANGQSKKMENGRKKN